MDGDYNQQWKQQWKTRTTIELAWLNWQIGSFVALAHGLGPRDEAGKKRQELRDRPFELERVAGARIRRMPHTN